MRAYQQRVVDEKTELDKKLTALRAFQETSTYAALDWGEKGRLAQQARAMENYSDILSQRIAAFQE